MITQIIRKIKNQFFPSMTICARCKWFKSEGGVWYNHFCTHPTHKRKKVINPVTGETGFADNNDLGRVYITDQPYPYARDINDGMCKTFNKKIC